MVRPQAPAQLQTCRSSWQRVLLQLDQRPAEVAAVARALQRWPLAQLHVGRAERRRHAEHEGRRAVARAAHVRLRTVENEPRDRVRAHQPRQDRRARAADDDLARVRHEELLVRQRAE